MGRRWDVPAIGVDGSVGELWIRVGAAARKDSGSGQGLDQAGIVTVAGADCASCVVGPRPSASAATVVA